MTNGIKVGDKVRVREDAPKLYTRWYECDFLHCDSAVKCVESDSAEIERSVGDNGDLYYLSIPLKYLIKVDDEAKEPKFKRGDKVVSKPPFVEKVWTVLGYDDKIPYMVKVGDGEYINERNLEPYTEPTEEKKSEAHQRATIISEGDIHSLYETQSHKFGSITIPVEADLTDSFWDVYTADLAKEVALKVANKYSDPKEAAEYAVSVAKAVVEGLKKK